MAEKSGALGVSCRGRYLVCGGCRAIREGAARASLKPEKDVHRLQVAEVGRDEERARNSAVYRFGPTMTSAWAPA